MAAIAAPLRLGEMHEGPFVLGRYWADHFSKIGAREGVDQPTVGELRAWIDDKQPMGLQPLTSSLVILTYAAQENLRFRRHGGSYPASDLVELPDDVELVAQQVPDEAIWELATARAGAIFGIVVPPLRSAANLERYGNNLVESASAKQGAVGNLRAQLEGNLVGSLGIDPNAPRLRSAREAEDLLRVLAKSSHIEALPTLAAESYEATDQELSSCISKAAEVAAAISGANWEMLGTVVGMSKGGEDEQAISIVEPLRTTAAGNEQAASLVDALAAAEKAATALLAERAATNSSSGATVEEKRGLSVAQAHELLAGLKDDGDGLEVDLVVRRRNP
jgi:hypothetical protein